MGPGNGARGIRCGPAGRGEDQSQTQGGSSGEEDCAGYGYRGCGGDIATERHNRCAGPEPREP